MFMTITIICIVFSIVSITALCCFVIKNNHSNGSIKSAGFYISVIATIISLFALVTNVFIGEKAVNNFFDFSIEYNLDNNSNSNISNESDINSDALDNNDISTTHQSSDNTIEENDSNAENTISFETSNENEVLSEQNTQNKTEALKECTTYTHEGSVIFEDVVSDPRGNSYNKAYLFYGEYYTLNTGGGEYGTSHITKYLGNKYAKFSAILNPYKTFDKYNKGIEATFNIYADDKLVYTTTLSRTSENVHIDLTVANTKYLKFELSAATELKSYQNQYSVILSNDILTIE